MRVGEGFFNSKQEEFVNVGDFCFLIFNCYTLCSVPAVEHFFYIRMQKMFLNGVLVSSYFGMQNMFLNEVLVSPYFGI